VVVEEAVDGVLELGGGRILARCHDGIEEARASLDLAASSSAAAAASRS
jgi:hypothetical protein